MALVTQDDEGEVENANGYITVAYFKTYFADRNVDVSDYDDDQIAGAIVAATDYIDTRYKYKGTKLNQDEDEEQTTEFPREDLYDRHDNLVEGLPSKLEKATAEYARQGLINGELAPLNTQAQVLSTREKVGPIEEETTYAAKTTPLFVSYPIADRLLDEYICASNFFTVFRA